MIGKINHNPRCEQPTGCKAIGGALCRACQIRSRIIAIHRDPIAKHDLIERQKKAWADPAKRARHAERQKKAWADPAKRALRGVLSPEQRAEIAEQVRTTDKSYLEIGLDWLISGGRVGSIAREFGVQRRAQPADHRRAA